MILAEWLAIESVVSVNSSDSPTHPCKISDTAIAVRVSQAGPDQGSGHNVDRSRPVSFAIG